VDWNSDGRPDLVTGERHGYLDVFIRGDTTLTAFWHYPLLDSTVLDVGMNSQPTVADWNGDGRKDLVLGEEGGSVRFFPNLTSDTWPGFQDFSYVEAGGSRINLLRANPYLVDLDQDGLLDLVCGSEYGFVLFYRNIGSRTSPLLAVAETVRTVAGAPVTPGPPTTLSSRCGFGDWNNDGVVDFLLSGNGGRVELFLGTMPTSTGEESRTAVPHLKVGSSVVAGVLELSQAASHQPQATSHLLDIAGRKVLELRPGPNDVGRLAPGVYFVTAGRPVLPRRVVVVQ
jgi:hypothetical protein